MTAHQWLIPALPAAVAVIGVLTLWLGLRGRRVDQHPVCRRCAYDLVGLPADRAACPECGNDLRRPRAVRTGNRRRRRGLLALGALLLLPGIAALALLGWVATRGTNVQSYKPVWWLVSEADGPDAAVRAAAFAQLTLRLNQGKLSEKQVRGIAERALELQADDARSWDPAWGDWVEQAQVMGWLPDDQWQRYVDRGINVRIKVRAAVRRGDVLPYRIEVPTRLGRSGLYRFRVFAHEPRFEFPGVSQPPRIGRMESLDLEVGRAWQAPLNVDGVLWLKAIPFDQLADGRRTLRLPLDLAVYPADSSGQRGQSPTGSPIVRKQLSPEAAWELLPADTPSFRKVAGRSLRDTLRGSLAASVWHERDDDSVGVSLVVRNPPVPLSFDVWIRAGSKEWKVGSGYIRQGGGTLDLGGAPRFRTPGRGSAAIIPGFNHDEVDVILRPSAREVARSLDGTELWDVDVIVPDVPVGRARDPMGRLRR
jgi:hypothetical protein